MFFRHFIAVLLFIVCSTTAFAQVGALTPAAKPSYISLPIAMKFSEIDNYIEKEMKGVLYEDTSYTDHNNDNITARVKKNGAMNIIGLTDGILIDLPIRIWVSKRTSFYTLNTDFDVTLHIISRIGIGPQLNIVAKSVLRDYKITRDPVVKVGGTDIDIKYVVQFCMDWSLPDILKEVDKGLADNDGIKKQVQDTWKSIQAPVTIDTGIRSWVRIVPQTLYLEPLKYYRDEIYLNGALEANIYTGIGRPGYSQATPFKDVVFKQKLDDGFHVFIRIELPYYEISAVATKMFADTTFTFSKKKTIKVTGVNVTGNDTTITVAVSTEGSIKSVIQLTGTPAYSDSTGEFYLNGFDYNLEWGQTMLRLADVLFKERMRKAFDKAMHVSVKDQIATARKSTTVFLSDYKLYNKIMISGSLSQFRLSSVGSNSDMIYAIFEMGGNARIRLLNLAN